jgi:L-ascorbate metabolism protein UlaG (beta-lactamase superfamily)
MKRTLTCALTVAVVALMLPASGRAQKAAPLASEPACRTLDLASINGPMPKDRNVVVLRWLATSNFEIAFRDNVFLLDAYYDRTPPARPVGFDFTKMKNATAIFIGHAHDDHISDAVAVAKQTGAPVYGGPQSYDFVRANGLTDKQAFLTKGGETLTFNGVTVQTMLAHHSILGPSFQKAGPPFREMQAALIRPRTEDEQKRQQTINARGSRDPKLAEEGTIAYLFTFDNGYRLYYQDSAGPPTEPQMAFMRTVPSVDLASIAYAGYLPQQGIDMAMPLITMVKPRVLIANHHDETGLRFTDMATEPLFEAVRDEMPGTRGFSLLYRSPMCINTATKEIFQGPGGPSTATSGR